MTLAVALTSDIAKNAGVAYVHYLSFMLCFGALVLERKLIKANPNRGEATAMVITDIVYGIAALALLVSGIFRVIHFGQGAEFYTQNPLFWWKVGLYLSVGGSLYPPSLTSWAIPLRKGELPRSLKPREPSALDHQHRAHWVRLDSLPRNADGPWRATAA